MKLFSYHRVETARQATAAAAEPGAKFISGGTNLLDLMKLEIEAPTRLVDITRLPLRELEETPDGGLRIGALVSNSDLAADRRVLSRYPLLSQALLAGASAQLRNRASAAGNLLQRTRCFYFYDRAVPCNKRVAGAGCAAIQGYNRIHAVLGASENCIAVHPSDMAVAMTALDARVETLTSGGLGRSIELDRLYRPPDASPDLETVLEPGELIVRIVLPPAPRGAQRYRKVRDRASFAFALVSVAVIVEIAEDKVIKGSRIAFGGLAPKPWRSFATERALLGREACQQVFETAAEIALEDARGHGHNNFKIALAKRTLVGTLAASVGLSGW